MWKRENVIPNLIIDLELNKLTEKRPKITPKVLKHNADKEFQKYIRRIRFFGVNWRLQHHDYFVAFPPQSNPNPLPYISTGNHKIVKDFNNTAIHANVDWHDPVNK